MFTQHHAVTRHPRRCGSKQSYTRMRVRTRSDLLDPWLVVERQSAGLLRYARARGTVALPVHYATSQHRIYLRLPIFNDACNFIDRADLAMDVRGSTVGRMSVTRIAGVGLLVPDTGCRQTSRTRSRRRGAAWPHARSRSFPSRCVNSTSSTISATRHWKINVPVCQAPSPTWATRSSRRLRRAMPL